MGPGNVENNFFGIRVSKQGLPVQNAQTAKDLLYTDNFSTKVYYDQTNSRIVEGKLPDGTYGMWVSKPGFDANNSTAATAGNLVFNSNQDIFKIIQTGTTTISAASLTTAANSYGLATQVSTVAHNLGYPPIVIAYSSDNISAFLNAMPFNIPTAVTSTSFVQFEMDFSVDTQNIYFDFNLFGYNRTSTYSLGPYTIKYFVLQESV